MHFIEIFIEFTLCSEYFSDFYCSHNIDSSFYPPNATRITFKGHLQDEENTRGHTRITDLADLRKPSANLAMKKAKKNLIKQNFQRPQGWHQVSIESEGE